MTMRTRTSIAAILLLAAGLAAPAAAQDQWEQQARNYLARWDSIMTDEGLTPRIAITTGSLNQGASGTVTMQLDGGANYVLVGACDDDCGDLDFVLYDPKGQEVARDTDTDAFPRVSVTPPQSGTYRVQVSMPGCTSSPCRYAVEGFSSAPAVQDDQWAAQVRQLLDQASTEMAGRGFQPTHRVYTGSLNAGASDSVSVDLVRGGDYRIVGVCDNDCSDVDLALFAPSGAALTSDVLTDDVPILTVVPSSTGQFSVRVDMVTCSADPCRYGIEVFAK